MKAGLAFALGAAVGAVVGMMLQNARRFELEAEAASGQPVSLWDVLSPHWLARWGRETTEQAMSERAHRRVAEMGNEA